MNNIIQLAHYGIIKISGNAAATFLQGQFTCDISEITPTTFRLTAYCNPQGRMWCIGRLWQQGNDYFLHLPLEIIPEVVKDLGKYALFSKVSVEALNNYGSLGLVGEEMVNNFLPNITVPNTPLSTLHSNDFSLLCIDSQRWLIIAATDTLQNVYEKLLTQHYQPAESNLWDLQEIRAGIPTVWKSTLEKLLPHDVNLPELGAVSFTKGCYKGQEIIARMQYRGQLKKHLYHASCTTPGLLTPGQTITDSSNKNIGEVVSCAPTSQHIYELLVILSDSAIQQQAALFINHNALCILAEPAIG